MARRAPNPEIRARILSGVEAAIGAHLGEVAVRHVLDHAGVSRRTFYQYFSGLDDARFALHEQFAGALVQTIATAVLAESDPIQRVRRGAAAFLDFQQQGGPALYVLQAEAARPGSPLYVTHERVLEQVIAFIRQQLVATLDVLVEPLVLRGILLGVEGVVIHLQRDGTFTAADRDRVGDSLEPVLIGLLSSAPRWGGRKDERD